MRVNQLYLDIDGLNAELEVTRRLVSDIKAQSIQGER